MSQRDLSILIKAAIDTSTSAIQDINKQISDLTSKINKLNVKINIDQSSLKELQLVLNKGVNEGFQKAEKGAGKFETELKKINKEIAEYQKARKTLIDQEKKALKESQKGDIFDLLSQGNVRRPLKGERFYEEYRNLPKEIQRLFQSAKDKTRKTIDEFSNDVGMDARNLLDIIGMGRAKFDVSNSTLIRQYDQQVSELTKRRDALVKKLKGKTVGEMVTEDMKLAQQETFRDKDGKAYGYRSTYKEDTFTRVINSDVNGKIQNIKDKEDFEKAQKEREEQNKRLKKVLDERKKLRGELNALQRNGITSDTQLERLSSAINSSKSLDDIKKAKEVLSDIKNIQKEAVNEINKINKANKNNTEELKSQLDLYKRQASIKADDLKRRFGSAADSNSIKNWLESINALDHNTPKVQHQMKSLALNFKEIELNAKKSALAVDKSNMSMLGMIKTAMVKFPVWMLATTAFYAPLHAMQAMVGQIVEIDKQLTELSKVMDASVNDVMRETVVLSSEYGRSLSESLDALTEFARAGNELPEAIQMTNAALLGANVMGLSVADTANYLTGAITQFNLEAANAVDIVNKWNEVDNNFSVTSAGLAQAMNKSGESAQQFGVTVDELNGMITAITESTRESGNIVGNMLKTVFARLNMDAAQDALKSINVEVTDLSGNMKSATQIYGEVAAQWGNLSRAEKTWLAESLAGKYHITRMMALLDNWGTMQDATATSMHSFGSAIEENIKHMSSLEAQITKVSSAGQLLSYTVGEAGLKQAMSAVLGVTASFIYGIVDITEKLDFAKIAIIGLSATIAVLGTQINTTMVTGMLRSVTAVASLTTAVGVLRGGIIALSTALWLNPITAIASVAALAIPLIVSYTGKQRMLREEMKQLSKDADAANKSIKTITDTLNVAGSTSKEQVAYFEGYVQNLGLLMERLRKLGSQNGEKYIDFGDLSEEIKEISKAVGVDITKFKTYEEAIAAINKRYLEQLGIYDKLKNNQADSYRTQINGAAVQRVLQEEYDASAKSLETYNKLLQDMAEGKEISASEAMELIKKEGQLAEAIKVENGIVTINKDLVEKLRNTKLSAFQESLKQKQKEVETEREALAAKLTFASSEIRAIKNVAMARAAAYKQTVAMAGNTDSEEGQAYLNSVMPDLVGIGEALEAIEKMRNVGVSALEDVGVQHEKESKKETDNAASTADKLEDIAQQTFENKKKLIEQEIDLLGRLREMQVDGSKEEQDYIDKEIEARQRKINLLKEEQKRQEQVSKTMTSSSEAYSTNTNTKSSTYKGKYADLINKYSTQRGLDPNFVAAVIKQESGFNTNAHSPADARGLMQIVPKWHPGLKNYYDPEENVKYGTGHLKGLLDKYQDPMLALAAYNAGGGNVDKAIKKAGSRKWSEVSKYLPKETQNYSPAIMANYGGDKNAISFAKQAAEAEGRVIDFTGEIQKLQQEIDQLNIQKIDSSLLSYKNRIADIDQQIEFSQASLIKYNSSSQQYRDELQKQIPLQKQKQNALHEENLAIKEVLEANARSKGTLLTPEKVKELSDRMEDNSAEWWNFEEAIRGVASAIHNSKVEELDDSISKLEHTLSLSESMMSMYEEGTKEYNSELERQISINQQIQSQLASKESYLKSMIATVAEGSDEWKEYTNQLQEVESAQLNVKKSLYDMRKDLADKIIDIYKDVYEKQKDLVIEAIENEMDAEDERHENVMDNYDKEMDKFEESINKQLALIDKQASEEDYNKNLTAAQKEAQDIQNKINVLSLDDSREAKVQREELEKELSDKLAEIEKMKSDKTRELRKDNLNDQLDAYKKDIEAKKEAEDKNYNTNKESLEKQKEDEEQYWEDKINNERYFAKLREEIMAGNLSTIKKDFGTFTSFLETNSKKIGDSLSENLLDKIDNLKDQLENLKNMDVGLGSGSSSSSSTKEAINKVITYKQQYDEAKAHNDTTGMKEAEESAKKYYAKLPKDIADKLHNMSAKQAEDWYKDNKNKFHTGGIAGETHFASPFGLKQDEIKTILKKSEITLQPPQMNSLLANFASGALKNLLSSIPMPNKNNGNVVFSPQVNVTVEGGLTDSKADLQKLAEKITDPIIDRFMHKLKPYGF